MNLKKLFVHIMLTTKQPIPEELPKKFLLFQMGYRPYFGLK